MKTKILLYNEKNIELKNSLSSYNNNINESMIKNEQLEKENSELKNELSNIKIQLEELKKNNKNLKEEIFRIKNQKKICESDIQKLKEKKLRKNKSQDNINIDDYRIQSALVSRKERLYKPYYWDNFNIKNLKKGKRDKLMPEGFELYEKNLKELGQN